MENKAQHVKEFYTRIEIPPEAQAEFDALALLAAQNPRYLALQEAYMESPSKNGDKVLEALDGMASLYNTSPYTLQFVFFIDCSYALRQMYRQRGVDEEIFWDSMYDLHCKLIECHDLYGIWGTFVGWWYWGFYDMTLFKLGRLEFEIRPFKADAFTAGGHTLRRDDPVLSMHIPSCGPLTRDLRMASYQKAYEFFLPQLGTPMGFVCDSWLLYPGHEEFLPKTSNILDFMHDFTVLTSNSSRSERGSWRIFGREYEAAEFHSMPEDTGLQRAYKKRLLEGGELGGGYGVFLFDGAKILQ